MGLLGRLARRAGRELPEFGPFEPKWNRARVNLRDRFAYKGGIESATEKDWYDLANSGRPGRKLRLPLSNLIATQETVAPDFAGVAASNAGKLPLIVREQGRYYILDGHHRLTALQDGGATDAEVLLFNSMWRPGR